MIFNIQRLYRAKAVLFMLLCYVGFALLGMSLVLLGHGNYGIIVCVALLFLAGPLAVSYLLKDRFLRPVSVEIAESYLKITEEAQEELVISWTTVAGYQVEITRVFFKAGYVLRLTRHDGSKTSLILIEPFFRDGNISEDSALYVLSRSIKKFNRSATQPVALRPNPFASRLGTILIALLGIMVLIAVILFLMKGRKSNHTSVFGLTMIVVILAAAVTGRKKAGDKVYRQLQD